MTGARWRISGKTAELFEDEKINVNKCKKCEGKKRFSKVFLKTTLQVTDTTVEAGLVQFK